MYVFRILYMLFCFGCLISVSYTHLDVYKRQILVNVISLVLACALNAKIKFKNTIKAFYFLPYMLGSLIVGFIFNYIFANLVPELGKALGIKALSVNILGTNNAIWGIIAVSLWIGCAFNTLIYIAGLQSIDTDVYEAADLDLSLIHIYVHM